MATRISRMLVVTSSDRRTCLAIGALLCLLLFASAVLIAYGIVFVATENRLLKIVPPITTSIGRSLCAETGSRFIGVEPPLLANGKYTFHCADGREVSDVLIDYSPNADES